MSSLGKKKSKRKSVVINKDRMEDDRRRVPSQVEAQFGQIGFVKWTNTYCPVLCVDPFDLFASGKLPAGIYHAWMYKIDTSTKELPLLLFWYGTNWEFSVVAASNFLPYEEAKELGYHKVPKFVQERSDFKRSLPAVYELLQSGLKQLNPHLRLKPQERQLDLSSDDAINAIILNEWHTLSMDPPSSFHQTFLRKGRSVERKFPAHLSQRFGQVAFSKFGKKGGQHHYHPVLVLNPFRVPPGPIRVEWFHRYAQQPPSSSSTTLVVYWLGAMTCGHKNVIDSAFSFCSSSNLIDYEEGVAKGYHHVGEALLDKYRQKRVSFTVDWRICGRWELEQALQKIPAERWGGLEDFEEDYTDDFDYYLECVNQGNEKQKLLAAEKKPNGNEAVSAAPAKEDRHRGNSRHIDETPAAEKKPNGNGAVSAAPANEDRHRNNGRQIDETPQIDPEEPVPAEEETTMNNKEKENPLGDDEPHPLGADEPHPLDVDEPHPLGVDEPHPLGVDEPPMHDVEAGPLEGDKFNNPNGEQISEPAIPKKKNQEDAGVIALFDHPSSSDSSNSKPPTKQKGRYVSCNDEEESELAESKHLFQDEDSDKSDDGDGKESAASSVEHKKSPIEQDASETESEEEDYKKKGRSSAKIPQDEGPDEAEEQVWSSIHACADVLHQETARLDSRKRKYIGQNRNKQVEVALLPSAASEEKVISNALNSDAKQRLHDLKRRKIETQEVVSKVIEEWTRKKKGTPHHKYL
jgi:hypothetical protein